MFDRSMRTTLAQRLVSIVSSVLDQTCFNRLATHFNISMFGHQTMFDGVGRQTVIVCLGPKTKTNRDSLVRVFPRFASATCNHFVFWLVHLIICVLCDWLEWLLWFWFYDTQLKTTLFFISTLSERSEIPLVEKQERRENCHLLPDMLDEERLDPHGVSILPNVLAMLNKSPTVRMEELNARITDVITKLQSISGWFLN